MRTLLILVLLLAVTVPFVVLAEPTDPDRPAFVPLTSIPGIESAGNADSLPDFLNSLYRLAIGLAAVLAVLQIVRAGIMYMGGDSVTEKKEAKSLIALSIGGLILILSPVVVFSVINPDILSLKINAIGELKQTEFERYKQGQEIGGDSCTVNLCTPPYTSVGRVEVAKGCNVAGSYEKIADTCCAGLTPGYICCGSKTVKPAAAPAATTPQSCQTTYSFVQATNACGSGYVEADNACCSTVGTGQKCCGKKKATTTTTQPAPSAWGWRYTVENPSGTQTTAKQGPYTTQKLCQDSIVPYMQKNNVVMSETQKAPCNCDKPLEEQTGCGTF